MISNLAQYRSVITRTTYLCILLIVIYQWYSIALPYQLNDAPLRNSEMELSPWLFRLSGLYSIVFGMPVMAAIWSFLLLAIPVLMIIRPKYHFLAIGYSVIYLFYLYGLYGNITHFQHPLMGGFWIQIAFWAAKDSSFSILWNCVRYYACWAFGSAGIWKFINGAIFQHDFGLAAFKSNYAWYLYQNPDTKRAHFYNFFLNHSELLNYGSAFIFILECLMLIGFFTKRFDYFLLGIWWFILINLFIFADVNFLPLGILSLPFVPIKCWGQLSHKLP